MSQKPIALDTAIQKLIDESYEIELRQQHFLVHSVPYVRPDRAVDMGIIVCPCPNPTVTSVPPDHTVHFIGSAPSNSDGTPLCVLHSSQTHEVEKGIEVHHYFSNKPDQYHHTGFPNYYEKIVHYVTLLTHAARAIDNNVDARTGRPFRSRNADSIFKYGDYSSVRGGIYAITQKLEKRRIALVGLGGTGGYILDQVAKTPVQEIHLYDDDIFGQHNAFRAPGAATFETLEAKPKKVDYFKGMYEPMRNGIYAHAYRITKENIDELRNFDFVFVSVDNGDARRLICTFLKDNRIPFIDVGMGLDRVEEKSSLTGSCRTTCVTPSKNDHMSLIPMNNDAGENLYRQNIQVADMNAMNALLAVIKWKQLCGFYHDSSQMHQVTYAVGLSSLTRSEPGNEC